MAEIARLHGVDGLSRKLKRLPRAVRRKQILRALRAGMRPITRAARSSVPVDTGLLKQKIRTRTVPARNSRQAGRIQLGVKVDRSGRKSGTDAFYWRFVEFGTTNMAAQSFLSAPFENNKRAAARKIKDMLLKGIAVEAKK